MVTRLGSEIQQPIDLLDLSPREEDTPGTLSSATGQFVRGFGESLAGGVEMIGRAANYINRKINPDEPESFIGGGFIQTAENIRGGFEDLGPDVDPEFAESFAGQVAGGLGSLAGFFVPGGAIKVIGTAARLGKGAGFTEKAAAGLTSAMFTAGAGGAEQRKDLENTLREQGIEPTQEAMQEAFEAGAPGGLLDLGPMGKMLRRLNKATGGVAKKSFNEKVKFFAKEVGTGTLEEAAQEGIQGMVQDLVARDFLKYDPDRNIFLDVPENAAVGGGVGLIANTLFTAFGLRKAGKIESALNAKNTKQLDTEVPEEITIDSVPDTPIINPLTKVAFDDPKITEAVRGIQALEQSKAENPALTENIDKAIEEQLKNLSSQFKTEPTKADLTGAPERIVETLQNLEANRGVQELVKNYREFKTFDPDEALAKSKPPVEGIEVTEQQVPVEEVQEVPSPGGIEVEELGVTPDPIPTEGIVLEGEEADLPVISTEDISVLEEEPVEISIDETPGVSTAGIQVQDLAEPLAPVEVEGIEVRDLDEPLEPVSKRGITAREIRAEEIQLTQDTVPQVIEQEARKTEVPTQTQSNVVTASIADGTAPNTDVKTLDTTPSSPEPVTPEKASEIISTVTQTPETSTIGEQAESALKSNVETVKPLTRGVEVSPQEVFTESPVQVPKEPSNSAVARRDRIQQELDTMAPNDPRRARKELALDAANRVVSKQAPVSEPNLEESLSVPKEIKNIAQRDLDSLERPSEKASQAMRKDAVNNFFGLKGKDKQDLLQSIDPIVESLKARLAPEVLNDIDILLIDSDGVRGQPDHFLSQGLRSDFDSFLSGQRGVPFGKFTPKTGRGNNTGKNTVAIYLKKGLTQEHVTRTLLHEIVGHYGMGKLIPNYDNFLLNVVKSNSSIASQVVRLRQRWVSYGIKPVAQGGPNRTRIFDPVTKKQQWFKNEDIARLANEYVAVQAESFSDPKIRDSYKKDFGVFKRIVARVKEFINQRFGQFFKTKYTDDDIMALLSESYARTFQEESSTYSKETLRALVGNQASQNLSMASRIKPEVRDKNFQSFMKGSKFKQPFKLAMVNQEQVNGLFMDDTQDLTGPGMVVMLPTREDSKNNKFFVRVTNPIRVRDDFSMKDWMSGLREAVRTNNLELTVEAYRNLIGQTQLPQETINQIEYIASKQETAGDVATAINKHLSTTNDGFYNRSAVVPLFSKQIKSVNNFGFFNQNDPHPLMSVMDHEAESAAGFQRVQQNFDPTVKKNQWQRILDSATNRIRTNPVAQKFYALGGLNAQKEYDIFSKRALGNIGRAEDLASSAMKVLKTLDPQMKQDIFDYFTTPGADINSINLPPQSRRIISQAKEEINSLGRSLVDNGLLDENIYQENADAYLPTKYLRYMETEFLGGGKRPSFMNYLKRQKDLPPDLKEMLGEIKDPAFLVPYTIGTLGRDVALLNFFNDITQQENLFWAIGAKPIEFRNRTYNKETFEDLKKSIQTQLETNLGLLSETQLDSLRDTLQEMENASQRASDEITAEIQRAQQQFGAKFQEDPLAPEEYLQKNYRQVPKNRRFGSLAGTHLRKEIYDDIVDVINAFTPVDQKTTMQKVFGQVEKAHQFWKLMKVPFNPPSWVRNGIGNMVLFDIASPTNFPTLLGHVRTALVDEINSIKGNPTSMFHTIAKDYGLFGTTFSTQELNLLRSDLLEITKMEQELNRLEKDKSTTGSAKRTWKHFQLMGRLKFNSLKEGATKGYGVLEGVFKSAALKDYIVRWEKQNKTKISRLSKDQRTQVVEEAVLFANEAIFDYSKVPSFLRDLRRYPIGAPFITYTYKAFPAAIKGALYRPQKMIKYLVLPYLLAHTTMALNDMDEEDYDKLEKKMPLWMQDKSSMYIIPFKDENDKWQVFDTGYFLPWAPYADIAKHASNHFRAGDIGEAVESAGTEGWNALKTFGALGGPLPDMITAIRANKDPFTGQDIVDPGAPAGTKIAQRLGYLYNLWAPSMFTPHGGINRTAKELGVWGKEDLTTYGTDKETLGQAALRLVGGSVSPFSEAESVRSTLANFGRRENQINKSRSKELKNIRNTQERAEINRRYNASLKVVRQERSEFLRSIR